MRYYFSFAKLLFLIAYSFVCVSSRANEESEKVHQMGPGVILLIEKIRNLSRVDLCNLSAVSKAIGTSVIVDGTDRRSLPERGASSSTRFDYIREILIGFNPRVGLYIDDGYGGRASCELRLQREGREWPALRLGDLEPHLAIRPQYIAKASSHLDRPPYLYELLDPKFIRLKVEIEVIEDWVELIYVRRK